LNKPNSIHARVYLKLCHTSNCNWFQTNKVSNRGCTHQFQKPYRFPYK